MAESAHSVPSQAPTRSELFGPFTKESRKSPERVTDTVVTDGIEKSKSASLPPQGSPVSATLLEQWERQGSTEAWRRRWETAPEEWKKYVMSREKSFGMGFAEEAKIARKNATYVATPPLSGNGGFGTMMIVGTVGAFSKVLMTTLNSLHTYQMDILFEAIENREKGRGLLSISNHQSVADDPFLLAALLPRRILLNPDAMRWGLCSLDICFQNPIVSRTLRLGKAMPIQRRGGIAQSFLIDAAEKLTRGDWVHIYPEGRVRQTGMGYVKRGVGKMLAMAYEANKGLPLILPMYHEGAETVMPQKPGSNQLQSTIPRIGKQMFVIAGEPLDVSHIFDRLMPDCLAAGGTEKDPPPCVRLYEEVSDFMAITLRLLRADLRQRVRKDHATDLGDPYEYS